MGKTPIQWCDHSINPIRFRNLETGKVGHYCEKISAGCKNCYSSKMQTGPYLSGLEFIKENFAKGELFFEPKAIQQVISRKKPTRYFWCDMTDMFGEFVPDAWVDLCFAAMSITPWHTHLALTKRANRMQTWAANGHATQHIEDALCKLAMSGMPIPDGPSRIKWPLRNVYFGVSCEDQQRADERIPLLLNTPAAVRFLSLEPLLGPIDIWQYLGGSRNPIGPAYGGRGVDWVIAGSESGPGARPAQIEWFRSIKDQCVAAGVPYFLKQYADAKGHKIGTPELDGQQWMQMPEAPCR